MGFFLISFIFTLAIAVPIWYNTMNDYAKKEG